MSAREDQDVNTIQSMGIRIPPHRGLVYTRFRFEWKEEKAYRFAWSPEMAAAGG